MPFLPPTPLRQSSIIYLKQDTFFVCVCGLCLRVCVLACVCVHIKTRTSTPYLTCSSSLTFSSVYISLFEYFVVSDVPFSMCWFTSSASLPSTVFLITLPPFILFLARCSIRLRTRGWLVSLLLICTCVSSVRTALFAFSCFYSDTSAEWDLIKPFSPISFFLFFLFSPHVATEWSKSGINSV